MHRTNPKQLDNIDIIYVDYAKAFVSHEKLLLKLRSYGIAGSLIEWIKYFITNRTQVVYIGDALSQPIIPSSCVLQDYILGPILFLIYINDLPNIFPDYIHVDLFADDTKKYYSCQSSPECNCNVRKMELYMSILSCST